MLSPPGTSSPECRSCCTSCVTGRQRLSLRGGSSVIAPTTRPTSPLRSSSPPKSGRSMVRSRGMRRAAGFLCDLSRSSRRAEPDGRARASVRPLAVGGAQPVGRPRGVSGRGGEVGVDLRGEVVLGDDALGALQGGGAQEGRDRLTGERGAPDDVSALLGCHAGRDAFCACHVSDRRRRRRAVSQAATFLVVPLWFQSERISGHLRAPESTHEQRERLREGATASSNPGAPIGSPLANPREDRRNGPSCRTSAGRAFARVRGCSVVAIAERLQRSANAVASGLPRRPLTCA